MEKKKTDIVWEDSNWRKPRELNEQAHERGEGDKQERDSSQFFHISETKPKRHKSTSKPIIFASFSAITIGVILGVLLLSMFTHLPNNREHSQTVGSSNESKNTNNEKESAEKNVYTMPHMHAHVLQVGLFGEESNAKEWLATYGEADIPTYMWKESDGYYLFAGLLKTKDVAKQEALKIKEAGFDAFTKVWETDGQDIQLTEMEYEWLESMVSQWESTLKSLTDQGDLSLDAWDDLLADTPSDMPHISELVEHIESLYSQEMVEAKEGEGQMILFSIWDHYARLSAD